MAIHGVDRTKHKRDRRRNDDMKTNEVLKELKSLIEKHGWFGQLGQTDYIRFKSPDDDRYRWNPLSALANHHHGEVNRMWEVPGARLDLEPAEIDDFHLACDSRWYRPQLRKRILDSCGLVDRKFDKVYLFMEKLVGKSKLAKILKTLSSEDRNALESAVGGPGRRKIEEVVRKY
jgi:hypothetical protein